MREVVCITHFSRCVPVRINESLFCVVKLFSNDHDDLELHVLAQVSLCAALKHSE